MDSSLKLQRNHFLLLINNARSSCFLCFRKWNVNPIHLWLSHMSIFTTKYATPSTHTTFSLWVLCKLSISTFSSRLFSFETCFLKCKTSSWAVERFSTDPTPEPYGVASLKFEQAESWWNKEIIFKTNRELTSDLWQSHACFVTFYSTSYSSCCFHHRNQAVFVVRKSELHLDFRPHSPNRRMLKGNNADPMLLHEVVSAHESGHDSPWAGWSSPRQSLSVHSLFLSSLFRLILGNSLRKGDG